jgi:NADH-quinone oxidoreductase subunit E
MRFIANELEISPAKVFGVATFFAHFAITPKGKHIIKVCNGTACHVKGSSFVINTVKDKLKLKDGQDTTEDMMFTLECVSCLGACGLAPVMVVDDVVHGILRHHLQHLRAVSVVQRVFIPDLFSLDQAVKLLSHAGTSISSNA